MSTTKQMSLMEMINRLSAGIEDDELFCQEKFEMVRNYCEQKSFMMSAAVPWMGALMASRSSRLRMLTLIPEPPDRLGK